MVHPKMCMVHPTAEGPAAAAHKCALKRAGLARMLNIPSGTKVGTLGQRECSFNRNAVDPCAPQGALT